MDSGDRDQDIISKLDLTARELKEKRAAQLQDNKEDDTATHDTPNLGRSCSLYNEPLGHHILQCTKGTLQDTLKEVTHSTPVGTLDRSSKDCPPILPNQPTSLPAPSPRNSNQLLSEVELSCQDMHRSPSKEAQMLTTLTTQPRVLLKKLSPEEIQSYQLSLTRTPQS